jgi:hypothetical protein
MHSLFFGLLWALLAFLILGAGPSMILGSSTRGLGFTIAVAPVVGFVLVTVSGTYLTRLDIPVERWAAPLLVVGASLSLLLILLRRSAELPAASFAERRAALWGAGGFVFTLVLALAPQLLGGLQYSILRGNGSDSFNYIAAANYLDHEPFSWAQRVDPQTLVNRDQSYERARRLLDTRWSTFMMLAFSARVAQVPPYVFEYCFSLLCLLLGYGPAFLYARSLELRPIYAALTAAAICLGFWAQVILDTRAQSQLNSIPVLLLLMLLISGIEDRIGDVASWADYSLVGVTAVSLAFLYIEIVPLAVLALLIFFAIRLRTPELASSSTSRYGLSGALALLGCMPVAHLLYRFGASQISYAAATINTWHLAYYGWLYSNPPAGFWGFGPLESSGTALTMASSAVVTALGVALTVAFFFALIHSLSKGRPAIRLAACTALAAVTEFGYLAVRGQFWAAGKALSFGYAFFILCLAGYCLTGSKTASLFSARPWQKMAAACALIFLISQNLLGIARPVLAVRKVEYPHYILQHGDYRKHSWDLSEFQKALDGQQGITVWSDVSDEWFSEYLDFALARQVKFINIGANLDANQPHARQQERSLSPQFLIVERSTRGFAGSESVPGVIASTAELSLIRSNPGGLTLMSVNNPNGLEKDPEGSFFWMGDKPTVFTLLSPINGCAIFSARLSLGPSSTLPFRTLIVGSGDSLNGGGVLMHGGQGKWQASVRIGTNEVPVTIKEKAMTYLPTDHRPLMLRIAGLKVEGGACEAGHR